MNELSGESYLLVRSAQGGDPQAREALFLRYRPWVMQVVALRMGRPLREIADCEDLVQETLFHAFERLESFEYRSEGSFRRWLAEIVHRRVADLWRSVHAQKRGEGRQPRRGASGSVLSASLFEGNLPTPSQAAMGRETEERIEDALLALEDRDRRVIELRRLCELSYVEIAESMELPTEGAARALFARALAKLSASF